MIPTTFGDGVSVCFLQCLNPVLALVMIPTAEVRRDPN